MDRAALPLLLASDRFATADEREPLDRLRMQKGVFLLQMRGPLRWRDSFDFFPWDWGPYSRDLAQTVGELTRGELMETRSVEGRQYPTYRTTPEGERLLATMALMPEEMDFVRKVRRFVTSRAFNQLLREVYAEHPEYAVNSRFHG